MIGQSSMAALPAEGQPAEGLERDAVFVYISFKFLVGMTKSGSTRSRSFLLPAGRIGPKSAKRFSDGSDAQEQAMGGIRFG
jgi:hypothetical protein